jgi:hypothetical protein
MNKELEELNKTKGFGGRVSLSIISGVGWLIFLIIWLFFYAGNFNIYQNIAIFIVSLLVIGGIMGAAWAPWGIRHGHEFEKQSENKKEIRNKIDEELERKKSKK